MRLPCPLIATGLLLQLAATDTGASITAYNVPAGTVGGQDFGGSLGMDFDVQNAAGIIVDRLGVFDSGSDVLNGPIEVGIFDRATGTLATGTTTVFAAGATGALEGGSRFLNLGAPLFLPAGFQGSIVAWGYNAAEPNGNGFGGAVPWTTDHGGAKLQFVGGSRWGNAGTYPANVDGGPANRFAAGSFSYNVISSPVSTFSALSRPVPVAGGQAFGGGIGIDFVVNGAGAVLTSLGAFDSNGDGILNAGITTQLWQRNTNGTPDTADDTGTLITSENFSAAVPGALDGSYRFKDIAGGLSLAAGDYTIVAYGYDAAEMNGNVGLGGSPYTDDGNGIITFVGRSRFGLTPGAFPDNADGFAAQYMGPGFKFTAIPEPAAVTVALLAGSLLLRRRRVLND